MKNKKMLKLYALGGSALIGIVSIFATVDMAFKKKEIKPVLKPEKKIIEKVSPVVKEKTEKIEKPYLNEEVKILKNYYDYQASEEEQENSIMYYESTYMPNYAVLYGGVDSFEVVSILDGVVTSIKEDTLLGNIIEIKHDNDLISVYQSVSDIAVEVNEVVHQGQVIAKSGLSNLNKDLKSHLLFELLYKNQIVNPLEYYDKNIKDLG